MTKSSAAKQAIFREPHPLARALLERTTPGSSVLEIGAGSGRNIAALIDAMNVTAIDSDTERVAALQERFADRGVHVSRAPYDRLPFVDQGFDAVLSTHALLHGTPADIEAILREIGRVNRRDALIFATFGSQRDARFGKGARVGAQSFAPTDGDEAGVTHSYFNERELRALLRDFKIERLEEVDVDRIAGAWAHVQTPLHGAVHWFAILRISSK